MLSKLAPIDNDSAESMQEYGKKLCEIIVGCRKLMLKHPKAPELPGFLHGPLQMLCDWNAYEDRMKKLSRLIDKHLRDNLPPPVTNGSASLYPFSLQQQLGIATYYSQAVIQKLSIPAIEYQLSGERQRIGYISSGVSTFPLMGKRCRHNREKLEVFYYNYTLGDIDPLLSDDQSTNENICDLTKFCSNEAMAQRIAADGIHILVNLDESSDKEGKLDAILALRPAPIQAVYRTRRGTTGAPWVDYFITDKVASPLQFAYGYSEKLAYMPNGLFICDAELPTKPSENPEETEKIRQRCRLPESAIVFGVDSKSNQIDPDLFECWCEILRKVPKSVLWLLNPYYEQAQINLRQEAKRNKINPNRLIFIDEAEDLDWTLMKDLVDVVLDTPLYNCFGLIVPICCGIPVVTMPRKSFLSRQTATVLTSIGCGELIAKSTWEYVQIAINLGNKPWLLAEMRAKMWEILPDSNLFRVDQYFNDLENLYMKMWKWREMGEKPEHIVCGNPFPLPYLL